MNSVPWSEINYRVVLVVIVATFVFVGCHRDETSDSSRPSKADVHTHDDRNAHAIHDHEQDAEDDHEDGHAHDADDVHQHDEHVETDGTATNHDASKEENRIAIPSAVRKNLGITFIKA